MIYDDGDPIDIEGWQPARSAQGMAVMRPPRGTRPVGEWHDLPFGFLTQLWKMPFDMEVYSGEKKM